MNAPAEPAQDSDLDRRFGGVARLYGDAAAVRLRNAHAVVVGLGGVGSWAAEALARCGVGRISLIDLDHVALSNTNRQIQALGDEYGKAKVAVMAERLRAIHPAVQVDTVEEFVDAGNAAALVPAADAVLDCIDQVVAKAALVVHCRAQRLPLVCCGAGGGRIDPTRIRRGDLARIEGDPLLAKLRHRLRREHGFPRVDARGRVPAFGVPAVYSDEPVRRPPVCEGQDLASGLACAGYGSSVMVTASLGMAAAALAVELMLARAVASPAA
jgi:tRNA A37 threonylcarbamoyladenosine dehydratase